MNKTEKELTNTEIQQIHCTLSLEIAADHFENLDPILFCNYMSDAADEWKKLEALYGRAVYARNAAHCLAREFNKRNSIPLDIANLDIANLE